MPDMPPWLPAAAFAAVIVSTVLKGLALRLRHGIRPYGFTRHREIQAAVERFWRLGTALLLGSIVIAWVRPDWEVWLGRPDWAGVALQTAGAALLCGGAAVAVLAQSGLGTSWRIGVPEEGPGALVTGGLFAMSRNPFFVGVFAMVLGLFCWSPTMLTAAALPLAAALMAIQVRIEEEALTEAHGEAYVAYMGRVRRWL